jgi:hypothetical protein
MCAVGACRRGSRRLASHVGFQCAQEIASTLSAGAAPGLAVSAPDEQLIQVLDAAGGLVDAMANVAGCPAGRDPATR